MSRIDNAVINADNAPLTLEDRAPRMTTPAYDDGLPPQGEMEEREDEIAAEIEVAARITNAERREPWEVYDVRENKTGVYYVLNVKSNGGLIVPVTVKHSTRFDTFVCFTCNTHNTCKHAKWVRRYTDKHAAA